MKLKILPFLFLALTMTACGSDSSDGTGSNESANTNSNFANANPATHRLEFPKLKDATTNIVIVHNSGGEVNYSVEYDTNKKLSRWSCYEIPQIRNPTKVSERCGPNRQECDFSSSD